MKQSVKTTLIVIGVILAVIAGTFGLLVLGGVIDIGGQAINAEIKKQTVNSRVKNKTYDTDNALSNIAAFHDRCNAVRREAQQVRNLAQRVVAARADAKGAQGIGAYQAQQAISEAESDLTASQNTLVAAAEDYNAASATKTKNPFKDAGLPYRINVPSDPSQLAGFSVECD